MNGQPWQVLSASGFPQKCRNEGELILQWPQEEKRTSKIHDHPDPVMKSGTTWTQNFQGEGTKEIYGSWATPGQKNYTHTHAYVHAYRNTLSSETWGKLELGRLFLISGTIIFLSLASGSPPTHCLLGLLSHWSLLPGFLC